MYGINLQLFNSKLRISIFYNLPKKLHFAQIVQKKKRKTLSLRFIRKNSAKVRKKNCAETTQILRQKI